MSQSQSQDPLSSFSQWGMPFNRRPQSPRPPSAPNQGPLSPYGPPTGQGQQQQGQQQGVQAVTGPNRAQMFMNPFSGGQRNAAVPMMTPPQQSQVSQFVPNLGGFTAQQPGISSNLVPMSTMGSQLNPQFLNWDQALAGAMGYDLNSQQGAANEMYNNLAAQTGQYEQALQGGLQTMGNAAEGVRQVGNAEADKLSVQAKQGIDKFYGFRDEQLGKMDQGIAKSNKQMADMVSGYEKAMGEFKDTSAQDSANAAFGLRRDAMAQSQQIDQMDLSPGEKAALKQQLMGDVGQQVTQAVTANFSNMNNKVSEMEQTLAGFRAAESQQTMSGTQLGTQAGISWGGMGLDAEKTRNDMSSLSAQLRMTSESAYASSMQQLVMTELSGRTAITEMIKSNPKQFMSLFAGLTGFMAAASTPGIENISIPYFGGRA